MNLFNPNPVSQLFQKQSSPQNFQQINPNQFNQLALSLDKTALQNLVLRARQQGISDEEIEIGLIYILNLKKLEEN